jgi:polycystin 1L2
MRQLRIDDHFSPGWSNQSTQVYSLSIQQAFQYRTSEQTYGSGGYVYEYRGRLSDLRRNLSVLHHLGWIDRQSQAVIIQFSLYNPNIELFTSVILLAEFLSTGGVYPQSRFEPVSF